MIALKERTLPGGVSPCCRLICLALLCCCPLASQADELGLPERWRLQADGRSGLLELTVGPAGAATGELLDRSVTGFLEGRRLVLRRTLGDRTEVWEGWLARDDSERFLAGTVTDEDGGHIRPWYAVPVAGVGSAPPPVPVVQENRFDDPGERVAPEPETPAPVADPEPMPADDWKGWDLSGSWFSSEGRVEIVQEGRRLSVILPDGNEQEGRFTAMDTVVVGLRKGCCKGKLEGPDVIRWSDGAVWQRAD